MIRYKIPDRKIILLLYHMYETVFSNTRIFRYSIYKIFYRESRLFILIIFHITICLLLLAVCKLTKFTSYKILYFILWTKLHNFPPIKPSWKINPWSEHHILYKFKIQNGCQFDIKPLIQVYMFQAEDHLSNAHFMLLHHICCSDVPSILYYSFQCQAGLC